MKKPKLGTKRVCPNCGIKYYDLERRPIICPSCGTRFEGPNVKARAVAAVAPKPQPVKEVAVEEKSEATQTVSLEQADAEAMETGAVDADVGDDESADADVAEDDDRTFLATEDDNDDDVGDIIGEVKKDDG